MNEYVDRNLAINFDGIGLIARASEYFLFIHFYVSMLLQQFLKSIFLY